MNKEFKKAVEEAKYVRDVLRPKLRKKGLLFDPMKPRERPLLLNFDIGNAGGNIMKPIKIVGKKRDGKSKLALNMGRQCGMSTKGIEIQQAKEKAIKWLAEWYDYKGDIQETDVYTVEKVVIDIALKARDEEWLKVIDKNTYEDGWINLTLVKQKLGIK